MIPHHIVPLFSTDWWQGLGISTFFILLVLITGIIFNKKGKELFFRNLLLAFLSLRFIVFYSYLLGSGQFTMRDSLPLHLCSLSAILCIVFLYKPKQILFEFLLLFSIVGALASLTTPEMTHGFSTFHFWEYYISHSSLIAVPLYAFIIMNYRPRSYSWLKAWLMINVFYFIIGFINWGLDSNYMYICTPPNVKHPLIIGEFPYHNIGLEIFGLVIGFLMYLFFGGLSKFLPIASEKTLV